MNIKLMEDSFTDEELNAVTACFKSKQYTQGKIVDEFEKKFAEWNESKYAVMVNSGSSANLIMVQLLKEKYGLKEGDEVIVPAVTWPTTVYPVIQNNLVPVFCDVDESYNLSVSSLKKMISSKTKALFLVHLLGQPAKMDEIVSICKEYNLVLIEDCCESLGALYSGKKVGNFGVMASYSFYFGHHMTTVEGGMIVTNNTEDQDLLKSMRSHGWIRGSARAEKYKSQYQNTDFIFDMLGYNLRSTNINAAIGLIQLKKLDESIQIRKENHSHFLSLMSNKSFLTQRIALDQTSSFSLGILFKDAKLRDFILSKLPGKGVECRPIVAGNLLKQPVFNNLNLRKDDVPMADRIHTQGVYLPNHQYINKEKVAYMVDKLNELVKEFENDQ